MKIWILTAFCNIICSLLFIGCIHIVIIDTPDDADKKIEATDKKTEITYINESPKVELKNEIKPVGQVQNFEPGNVPTIDELGD